MKITELYRLSNNVIEILGDKSVVEIVIYLNEAKHENLQQEVYRLNNGTLINYKSMELFYILIGNIKYIIKIKK
jgi:hypothetical protein